MTCSYEEQTTGTLENQRKKMAFRLFLIDCTWQAFNSICLREAKIPSWRRLHANKPLRTECNCSLAPTNLLLCLALLLYFFKVQNKWSKFCFLCVQQEWRHFFKDTPRVVWRGVGAGVGFCWLQLQSINRHDMPRAIKRDVSIRRATVIHDNNLKIHQRSAANFKALTQRPGRRLVSMKDGNLDEWYEPFTFHKIKRFIHDGRGGANRRSSDQD